MKDKITANARIRVRRENSITIYGEGTKETLVVIREGQEFAAEISESGAAFDTAFGVLSLPLAEVEILDEK